MFKEVDARGMNYPLAVIHTKKALETIGEGKVTTIVDSEVVKENISNFAKSMDLKVNIQESKGNYYIDIFKEHTINKMSSMDIQYDTGDKKDLVILITKDRLGEGSEELGKILMKGYIYTLTEVNPLPKILIFLNSGVNLAVEGSQVIDYLINLERKGVEIICCGTSLDYFKVKNKLMVGGIGSMYKIIEKLNHAKSTISL